ncbi:unnamed protein product [Durusdinium trenchii]|uniref:TIR domain-containing protein n=2 Tax=Durusdinium trenchii TaxID=1381693 RepID=A0ABP0LNC0_9DINO
MALELRDASEGKMVSERFQELKSLLVQLGELAWRQGTTAIEEACKVLDIAYKESEILEICEEISGGTFETQGEPLDVAVCDFLAYLLRSTPAEQEFESLNPSENATAIHRLEERALPLHYFRALFRFAEGVSYNGELWYDLEQHLPSIKLPKLNIYQVHHWIIEPLTFREDFSYAEVVINETKPPKRIWFISHWWGEAMCNFVQCLAKHIDIRRMSVSRTAYWAAWAAIGPSDAAPTGRATAAADALLTARVLAPRQVLLMLGPEGEAFRRSWCVLEMAVATGLGEARKDHQKPRSGTLDLVTMRPDVRLPVVLTDGLTEVEEEWEAKHPGMGHIGKTDREKSFPLEALHTGLGVDFASCKTSVPAERTWIYHFLERLVLVDEPASAEGISRHLRSFFARTAVVQVLNRQLPVAPYLAVIAQNVVQKELTLPCLAHVLEDPETFLSLLSQSLASLTELESLKLDLGWRSIYANGHVSHLASAECLAEGLRNLGHLKELALRLNGCVNLLHLGWSPAPPTLTLQRLELRLDGCERLQDLSELLRCIGDLQQLTSLQLSLAGCKGLMVDSDLVLLGKSLRQLPKLRQLFLDLSGAKRIFYVIELGKSIRCLRDLQEFHLDLSFCVNLSDISHLGNSIRILLTETTFGTGPFMLKLEKSGVRINREKVVGYDTAQGFVKALGVRALSDPEDDVGLQVEKPQSTVWLTHLEEMAIKRSFRLPMGCQGFHKGCPRLY